MRRSWPQATRASEHEPLESLRIVSLELRDQTATRCTFDVVFDVKVKGDGLSMTDGSYPWSYELTWNADQSSWLSAVASYYAVLFLCSVDWADA